MSHSRPLSRAIALATLLTMGSAALASGQPPTSDVVREWNAIMVATVSGQNPFAQGRFAAITQLAVFDAVNAIDRRHVPYLPGTVAPPGASAAAAAVAAAHKTLATYFPAVAAALDTARAASLADIPDGAGKSTASWSASRPPQPSSRTGPATDRRRRSFICQRRPSRVNGSSRRPAPPRAAC